MNIIVYIEPLKTFTSGMPHRGMLKELIKIRKNDHFILVLRKGLIPGFLNKMLDELQVFDNWELKIEKRSSRVSNLLALFKIKNHCNLDVVGDIYLNLDADFLGIKNSPQIITVHDLSSVIKGGVSSISLIKKIARKFTISNGIRHADYIITISEFTKNDILSEFKILKPITVIYNGIDSQWHNQVTTRDNSQEYYWIWYGGFNKRKNLKNLLLAYEQFLIENKQTSLNIPNLKLIGNKNQHYFELKEMIDNSSTLTKKVIIKPQMELKQLIEEVANSNGLLFPSFYEGFGLPVIETYSQGVQVLTSNLSSLPEISGGEAILVNPNELLDIKKGLSRLNNIKQIKTDLLKKIANNFTYEKCALKYSTLIDEIIRE